MNDANQERFIFYNLALGDMIRVKKDVEYLKRTSDEHLLNVLRRDAIVSYCKPFSANRGEFQKNNLVVPESFIPKSLRSKHKEIITARNKVVAHMDMSKQSAKLERYEVNGELCYSFSVKSYELESFSELVPGIEKLATAVEKALLNESKKLEDSF